MKKYQLHDSQINGITISDNSIVFSFSEGFWETDESGKEITQKQNCKIAFNIDNKFNLRVEEFISVRISGRNNVFKPISLARFVNLLKKTKFNVDMEYDCLFAKSKMLQLYSNSSKILVEFFIKEIERVEYFCD